MKRYIAIVTIMLMLLSLSACGPQSPEKGSKETIRQEPATESTEAEDNAGLPSLTVTEAPFDYKTMLRVSLPEFGLENVYICDASAKEMYLDADTWGQVYLLCDDSRSLGDHYLLTVIKDQMFLKDLRDEYSFKLGGHIVLCDIDSDQDCEVILQETVDMAGGAGSYLSRIFDYRNDEYVEIFSSDDFFETNGMDLGFSITLLKDQYFRIDNSITGYSETFRKETENTDYFKYWYDENGEPYQKNMMVDTFYQFQPIDTDADGVYEIACSQYTSLIGHANGIGTAKTVLKYNAQTSAFEIIDASYEQWS